MFQPRMDFPGVAPDSPGTVVRVRAVNDYLRVDGNYFCAGMEAGILLKMEEK